MRCLNFEWFLIFLQLQTDIDFDYATLYAQQQAGLIVKSSANRVSVSSSSSVGLSPHRRIAVSDPAVAPPTNTAKLRDPCSRRTEKPRRRQAAKFDVNRQLLHSLSISCKGIFGRLHVAGVEQFQTENLGFFFFSANDYFL